MPSPLSLLGKLIRYLTGIRVTSGKPMEFQNRFIFPAPPPRGEPYVDCQYLPRNLLNLILEDRDAVDGIGHIYVSSATYCKKKKGAQHEFIVFLVKDNTYNRDTPPNNVDDLTENDIRALQGNNAPTDDSILNSTSPSSEVPSARGNVLSSGEGSALSNGRLPALDMCRVSAFGGFNGMSYRLGLDACSSLAELTFNDDSFTLEQLLIIAATLSTHKPHYDLFKTQCYWYALMLWDLMQRVSGTTAPPFANGSVRPGSNRLAPWLVRQPQGSERQNELEELMAEYEGRWQTFSEELPGYKSRGVKALQAMINRHINAPVVQAPPPEPVGSYPVG